MWCVQTCKGIGLGGTERYVGEGELRLTGRQGLDHGPEELDGAADLDVEEARSQHQSWGKSIVRKER